MRLADDDTTTPGDLRILALAGFRRVAPGRWTDAEGEGRQLGTAAALRTARRDVEREAGAASAGGTDRC